MDRDSVRRLPKETPCCSRSPVRLDRPRGIPAGFGGTPASSTRTRRTTTSSCWGVRARMAAALDCTRLLTAGGTLRAHRRDRDGGRATFSDRWGCPSRGGHNVQSLRWVRNPRRSPGRGSKRVGTFNDQKLSWPRAPWTRSSSAARCFDKTLAPRARRGWPPAASPRMPGCFPRGLSPRISTKSALIPRFRR